MMKKIFNKLFLSLLAIVFCVDFYKAPPPPPSGGGGPTTPGAPASPIDMYLLILGFVAFVLILVFTKRMKINKA
ncbi:MULTISPECIES: signal peptidase [Amniculibacterium]|jgi:hypothetical protein|uniref:signal peptidase n=1 Tax=Amniculibacterium TaxID=2715289 RepID=UPI000F5A1393|nr:MULTISPECIES: signal peptidase [Amniculibacterium]